MNPKELKDILEKAKTIAIVGAKDTPGQAVTNVGRYLIDAGYTVIPVHPTRKEVWGLKAYPSLADIPEDIDIVDVFRSSEFCEAHAAEACGLTYTPMLFWLQLGIVNTIAMELAEENGMAAVENACLMVEHCKLFDRKPVH